MMSSGTQNRKKMFMRRVCHIFPLGEAILAQTKSLHNAAVLAEVLRQDEVGLL